MRLVPFLLAAALAAPSAWAQGTPKPPVAAQRPHAVQAPAGTRNDEYYWLRDDTRKNPEMLAYLAAENAYADAVLAPQRPVKEMLNAEFVGRIKQDDASVPFRLRGHWYYTRFETGKDYAVVARRAGSMQAPEQVLIDQNARAEGQGYYTVGQWAVSDDNARLAWSEDTVGRYQFALRIKDIASGRMLPDTVSNIEPDVVWSRDGRSVLYIEKDPVTLLSKRVKLHVLGTPASADRLLYEEPDDSFYLSLARTRSDAFICILATSTTQTEQRCTSAEDPGAFQVVAPRSRDHLYRADHLGSRWVIRTNWDAPNYRLMTLPAGAPLGDRGRWQAFVPHDREVFIEEFQLFDGFTAIEERAGGVKRLRMLKADGSSALVASDEPAYTMGFGTNAEPQATALRYTYTSLTTPLTTYDVEVGTGARTLLKRHPVPGYDPAQYVTERVWAPARDGTRIPVSLVYRKGFKRDGTAALYQVGYGSYGSSWDAEFQMPAVSLLDRGVVFAVAHIRGGQDMGRAWYDQGRLLAKKNSFTDFIDVTRHLVAEKYAAPSRMAAEGASAGGLLMGAVANMAPQDYRVIVARVPFVDVVTTMLDESIPLTTNEFDEWGNPKDPAYYAYMLSYSPYDNVAAKAYPSLYVYTGLWDSQVQYFEPAKWVARLRARKTDANPLVFRVGMEAGHGGKSGRFRRYAEIAEFYAFALARLGVEPAVTPRSASAADE
ncbi:S9 family peptidase [Phenylobacterium sp.]|uniref:S9 family peptidase n=1 Tax=Phenylobacterium sp. TaxID=1871053 RepID=UPI0035AEC4ED